jgi:hypothetical protein
MHVYVHVVHVCGRQGCLCDSLTPAGYAGMRCSVRIEKKFSPNSPLASNDRDYYGSNLELSPGVEALRREPRPSILVVGPNKCLSRYCLFCRPTKDGQDLTGSESPLLSCMCFGRASINYARRAPNLAGRSQGH